MIKLFTVALSGLLLLASCQTANNNEPSKYPEAKFNKKMESEDTEKNEFSIHKEAALNDFMTWYTYTYNNIHLSQDFISLNVDSTIIKKTDFLKKLITGDFVPFKIAVQNKVAVYKLFKLQHPIQDIQSTIKQMAATEMKHLSMEGLELPDYNFSDLNGTQYNKINTRGRILLLKCWFINCVACVKEFPELNELVNQYKDVNDLLFVSLASDARKDLVSFLDKREFKYAVVPNQKDYMNNKLKVTAYPTHVLVNKKGKIVKVTNSVEEMIPFLEREVF